MRPELTKRQAKVLGFIKDFAAHNGYPPSLREIADRFKIAVNGAAGHARALQKKGYLRRDAGRARGLVVE